MAKNLVIVESPAKSKTIEKFLGRNYTVRASGWHLAYILGLDPESDCRIEFHEITPGAVKEALKHPRKIDLDMVDAQQTRRIIDRIVGYQLSPLLWRKIRKGLSAGRVQTVAVKIICDREKEIAGFVPQEYWTITARLREKDKAPLFDADVIKYNGKKLEITSAEEAAKVEAALKTAAYVVEEATKKERRRNPLPPYTTSSLQQDAVRKLNFSTKKTMMLAQQLYEGVNVGKGGAVGLITYMRTDSVRLSDVATAELRSFIGSTYGEEYVPQHVNVYSSKKNAQDAHEAIRPTSVERTPEAVAQYLTKDQLKLYTLIWNRTVACQMKAALYDVTTLAGGAVLKFDGFLKLSDKKELASEKEKAVPYLPAQTPLKLYKLLPAEQHFTEPPPHFTEATLVKELEEKGIGRPSTYSPTIQTILDRGYIVKDGKKLVSTELGELIVNMLTTYFKDIINIPFTANLETELDEIAEHEANKETVLEEFYKPFSTLMEKADKEIETVEAPVEVSDVKCEKCGRMMVYKQGRYGKFLACPGFPECRNTKPILKKIGVKCPECGGDVIERRTKTRKVFYGCSNYPECKFTSWDRPTEQRCPKCGHVLYERTDKNGTQKLFCINEACEDAVKTYKGKAAANAKSK